MLLYYSQSYRIHLIQIKLGYSYFNIIGQASPLMIIKGYVFGKQSIFKFVEFLKKNLFYCLSQLDLDFTKIFLKLSCMFMLSIPFLMRN